MSGSTSCREALSKVYDFLDGELPDATSADIAAHLETCRRCWPAFNFERLFLDRLAALSERPERCEGLAERVRKVLEAEVEDD